MKLIVYESYSIESYSIEVYVMCQVKYILERLVDPFLNLARCFCKAGIKSETAVKKDSIPTN